MLIICSGEIITTHACTHTPNTHVHTHTTHTYTHTQAHVHTNTHRRAGTQTQARAASALQYNHLQTRGREHFTLFFHETVKNLTIAIQTDIFISTV